MESKSLSSFIFIPLSCLIFIRPIFSGLAHPVFEFYYETSVIFLAIITLSFSIRKVYIKQDRLPRAKNYYAIPILLLSLACILSTITSINMQNSIKETIKFISYISIFFIVSQADTNQKKILIKIIVICASIISIYCIYQYIWGYQHTLDYLKKINGNIILTHIHDLYARNILIDKRAIGTFPSPNILGGYLLMVFFLALAMLKNLASQKRWLFAPLLIIIALMLTKSLGAWISLIASLIILFFISYSAIKRYKLILILSFACIFLTLLFIILGRWDRIIDLGNPHNSITMRLNYWFTATSIIKDHPFLGIGPGNFQEVFLKYYKLGWGTGTRYVHNIFLQTWVETGILGLLGMISLIIVFITKNTIKSNYIFLAGLVFLFHNLIDITYFIPEVGIFWWVIINLAQ